MEIAAGSSIEYRETGQPTAALFFTDVDGDALTYTATTGPPGLLGASLSGAGGSARLQLTGLNQGSATVTLTAIDPYGGEVRRTATFTITASEERSILEFSPAGTAVGDPVTGTPYQGTPLVYSLAGNIVESGLFVINSATGQISVAEGAVIDSSVVDSHREAMEGQESKQFYSGEVRYRVGDQNAAIQVRIFVTEVKPGAPGRPALAPRTSSETGNPGLDASWTAADANGLTLTGYQVRYRKQGETEWTPYSGTLPASAASATLPDLDATTTYEAQVRAVANIGAPADIFLSVDKTSLRESTQSYYVNVTATRQGTSGEVTVALAFSGTASMVVDYSPDPSNPTITIADGAASGTVELRMAVVTDGEKEGSETIILSGTAAGLTVGSVVVTVIDNDYPGEPIMASPERFGPWSETGTGITGERNIIILSASPDTIGEDAGATEATVTATLNAALAADTVVVLTLGGTAAAPADYSATSLASITIPKGQTSAEGTLTITPVEDETAEGDESIEVTGSYKRFTVSPDTITLTDNDTATVGISGPSGEVAEGEDAAFTVTLSKAIASETTVAWSAPLATDTAVAADLGTTSGAVTFAANSAAGATQTISIAITDDTTLEPAETFTVTLGAVGGDLAGYVTVDPAAASATATIAKDASFGAHITLSFDPEYVQEGQTNVVTLTATRDSTEGDHTVDWSVATRPNKLPPTAPTTQRGEAAPATTDRVPTTLCVHFPPMCASRRASPAHRRP